MQKSIKDTFIENMIMSQHGEKIKQVQELMIEKLQKAKHSIEQFIIREVSGNNSLELLNEYKLRLKAVEELLNKVRYNFLDLNLDTIFIEIGWDNKKEYEELLEALKEPCKCESYVKGCENTKEIKVILNQDWDDAMKLSTDWIKQLGEALKKNNGSWC